VCESKKTKRKRRGRWLELTVTVVTMGRTWKAESPENQPVKPYGLNKVVNSQ